MLCQLCKKESKLKWKCLDCRLMMCQRCRDKVHKKIESAQDHTIIGIKGKSKHKTDSDSKPDLKKLKCQEHRRQTCCLYCKTCQELVCLICITKSHNKHEFGDISDEYSIKMEKIRNGKKNIGRVMRTLYVSEQKWKQIKLNEQSNYLKAKKEILDYEEALVNEVTKQTNQLLEDLDQNWKDVYKYIDDEEKKLVEQQAQIQKQLQEINIQLQQMSAKDVISGSNSMLKSMETNVSPVTISFYGVPQFIPGYKTQNSLKLGKLEDVIIGDRTELQVDKQFETDLEEISSVISCPDGSLWLCDFYLNNVQRVKQNGDNLYAFSNIKIEVFDATLLPYGDLLVSDESSNLKLIPSGSTDIKDSVYTVSPLGTTAVHVTCDHKVIVGAVDSSDIPATGSRQVIVMDKTGHHQKVFQYDGQNKPLFTYPRRIASNRQGNIAVVDILSNDDRGRVVVLDKEGEVRNIYTGHSGVNSGDNPLIPKGITTTPSDNFVIADIENNTLHILNNEGKIISFYNTEKIGMLLPFSLSFSTTGKLYIGCTTYNDGDNADIFVIHNFIF